MEISNINKTPACGGYKFKFSIILSVYKVEEFIDEAVKSLLDQTIGFEENVQIIMVDDGSPDNSGAICDKYKSLYPNNIVVVHKPNGGLSSARNEGLRHIEGEYVNFFDPDDILSPNTLADVYEFCKDHSEVDVVAIPLVYFGDKEGPHHLNNKFNGGTRVINLRKEYKYVHLSSAASFIKHEIAKKQHYNPNLVVAEDAEQILRALIDNPYLGVVSTCTYNYRRREGSQVTSASSKPGWYSDYVKLFSLAVFEYAEQKYGYIPKFVQNAIMCDLRWKYHETSIPEFLTEEEIREYRSLLGAVIDKIDDSVLMMQTNLIIDIKIAILAKKHGLENYVQYSPSDVYYGADSNSDWRYSRNSLQLSFLEDTGDDFTLSVRQIMFAFHEEMGKMFIKVGDEFIESYEQKKADVRYSIDEPVSYWCLGSFRIPKRLIKADTQISVWTLVKPGVFVKNNNLKTGYFFPVSGKYRNAYCVFDGYSFKLDLKTNEVIASTCTKKQGRKLEKAFVKELWASNGLGERKAAIARTLHKFWSVFHKKDIWLISDRLNKGGDNGEALFRYLNETKFRKAEYYYAIAKGSEYKRIKKCGGKVIDRNSLKYKFLHISAKHVISSHADDFVINPFLNYYEAYRDLIKNVNFIFLQHGVTKDDISGWLNRYAKNIKGFVTAAKREKDSIVNGNYHYPEKNVWLTGFARFDRLYNDEQRYITLMPTWRRYLMTDFNKETGEWEESSYFVTSEYFKFYNGLITDERLLKAAKEYGYTVCFMPHPNIIIHKDLFRQKEGVKFFSINDEYRDVYAKSDLVLTDYSSAVFDFAYMRKPVVYAHFDSKDFFAGEHIYTKGYFDYEDDGFGEVVYDLDSTVELLIDYMKNNCKLKDKYRERIDNFFAFNDKDNCKRITEKILEIK